jgi:hypothetical protein
MEQMEYLEEIRRKFFLDILVILLLLSTFLQPYLYGGVEAIRKCEENVKICLRKQDCDNVNEMKNTKVGNEEWVSCSYDDDNPTCLMITGF